MLSYLKNVVIIHGPFRGLSRIDFCADWADNHWRRSCVSTIRFDSRQFRYVYYPVRTVTSGNVTHMHYALSFPRVLDLATLHLVHRRHTCWWWRAPQSTSWCACLAPWHAGPCPVGQSLSGTSKLVSAMNFGCLPGFYFYFQSGIWNIPLLFLLTPNHMYSRNFPHSSLGTYIKKIKKMCIGSGVASNLELNALFDSLAFGKYQIGTNTINKGYMMYRIFARI